VSTAIERVTRIDEDQKHTLVSLWIMKKLDLKTEDGGMEFPVVLPSELSPLDETLQQLAVEDYVQINGKKGRYELTKKGIAYLREVIDEAADMVEELDDLETDEAIAELRARNLDLLRARFLWGWYEGEFDDLVLFQERRGVQPVERLWAFYLTSDAFFRELAKDFG
jgi:DNA-binding PadR family transcriptional regulator